MATLVQRFLTGAAPAAAGASLSNIGAAYAALGANAAFPPTQEEIAAAKKRICGELEAKEKSRQYFTIPENRYYVQHCGKTEANLPVGPYKPTPPRNNLPNQMKKAVAKSYNLLRRGLTDPIDPMRYPMEGGKHRKTHKRRRTHKKRKHTRKH